MGYNIAYTAFAERDIWEIAAYLSDHSEEATKNYLISLRKSIEHLADMPNMYPKIDQYKEYRKMVVGDYVVTYVVNDALKQVTILRVVHGKRSYLS